MNELLLDQDGKPLTKNALKKLEKQREKDLKKEQVAARLAEEKLLREAGSPVFKTDLTIGFFYRAVRKVSDESVSRSQEPKNHKSI